MKMVILAFRLSLLTILIITISRSSALDSLNDHTKRSELFPDHAAYDPLILDPYHIHGAPYGGFSRSVQSRLASLPIHLPEILEYDMKKSVVPNYDPMYFEVRDDGGRFFVCRLYQEDELMPESLYDGMFDTPILREKSNESEAVSQSDEHNLNDGEVVDASLLISSVKQVNGDDVTTTAPNEVSSEEISAPQHLTNVAESNPSTEIDNVDITTPKAESELPVTDVAPNDESSSANAMSRQQVMLTMLEIEIRLQELTNICGQIHKGWWSYEWCYGEAITQFHIDYNVETNTIQVDSVLDLGHYKQRKISLDVEKLPHNEYAEGTPEMAHVTDIYGDGSVCDETGEARVTNVNMVCCSESIAQQHKGVLHKQGHPITSNVAVFIDIEEDEDILCLYNVTVCTPLLCGAVAVDDDFVSGIDTSGKSEYRVISRSIPTEKEMAMVNENESIREILDRVLNMLCLQTNLGGWWTYEMCYKKSIRQFHETIGTKRNSAGAKIAAKVTESEHILGLYDETKERAEIPDTEEWNLVVNATISRTGSSSGGGVAGGNAWGEGSGAYYEIEYTGGEVCDHTDVTDAAIVAGSTSGVGGGVERSSTVRYYCGELYDVAVHEDTTCHYIVQVKVPALCQHRLFRAPSAKKQVIKCLPVDEEQ